MIDMEEFAAFLGFDGGAEDGKRARCESQARNFINVSLIAAVAASDGALRPNKASLRLLRLQNPCVANDATDGDGDGEHLMDMISDVGHNVLDVAGMVPVIGEVADLANASWYAAEGEYGNAAVSAAAAVPFIGNAATAGKLGSRIAKSSDDVVDDIMDDINIDIRGSAAQGFWSIAVPSAAIGAVFGAVSYQRYWFLGARVVKILSRRWKRQ